jgi:Reverse transcriptase (RNA-dependent DNA polymerase)
MIYFMAPYHPGSLISNLLIPWQLSKRLTTFNPNSTIMVSLQSIWAPPLITPIMFTSSGTLKPNHSFVHKTRFFFQLPFQITSRFPPKTLPKYTSLMRVLMILIPFQHHGSPPMRSLTLQRTYSQTPLSITRLLQLHHLHIPSLMILMLMPTPYLLQLMVNSNPSRFPSFIASLASRANYGIFLPLITPIFMKQQSTLFPPPPQKRIRFSTKHVAHQATIFDGSPEPKTYRESLQCPDAANWWVVICTEFDNMERTRVWEIRPKITIPKGRKIIGARWVFARKDDGRYRARCVAKAFSQIHGKDFQENHAPVVSDTTICSRLRS